MTTVAHALRRKTGQEFMDEAIEAHRKLLEEKLTEVLDKHSLKLSDEGVELLIKSPDDNPLGIIYELRKNGAIIETFGYELDLTMQV